MRKPLNPKIHGILDYVYGSALLITPFVLGFAQDLTSNLFYLMGGGHIVLSLFTAYPVGLFKIIPFSTHSLFEIGAAVLLMGAPWLYGFAYIPIQTATSLFCGIGLAAVYMLTDYYGSGTSRVQKIYPDFFQKRRAA